MRWLSILAALLLWLGRAAGAVDVVSIDVPLQPVAVSAPVSASIAAPQLALPGQSLAALPSILPTPASDSAPAQAAAPEAAAARPQAGGEQASVASGARFDGTRGSHPFDDVQPPPLAALDTREAAAAQAVRSPLAALAPAGLASVFNARAQRAHAARARAQRMTTEEESMREGLASANLLVQAGRPQEALDLLTTQFESKHARDWYRQNPAYLPYWTEGMRFYRLIERGLMHDLEAVKRRAGDGRLIAEAGAAYRPTEIQARGSGHCAYHALANAIEASAGFARPTSVNELIAFARRAFNRELHPHLSAAEAQALGVPKRIDVGAGLGPETTTELARLLGLEFSARPAPRSEEELLELLRGPRRVIAVLRLFHGGARLEPGLAEDAGHAHRPVYHAVHLLGAFRSRVTGGWVFMAQDSGSGTTDFYTWREFGDLVESVELARAPRPVSLP